MIQSIFHSSLWTAIFCIFWQRSRSFVGRNCMHRLKPLSWYLYFTFATLRDIITPGWIWIRRIWIRGIQCACIALPQFHIDPLLTRGIHTGVTGVHIWTNTVAITAELLSIRARIRWAWHRWCNIWFQTMRHDHVRVSIIPAEDRHGWRLKQV